MATIFIAGAGRGFGRGTALEFASRGDSLALLARTKDNLESVARAAEEAGSRALVLPADVGDAAAVETAVERTVSVLGGIDVLVYAAGAMAGMGPFEQLTWDTFRTNYDADVHGMFNVLQSVLPVMRRQGKGTIVNVSSSAAISSAPFITPYGSAKAAQVAFTVCLQAELAGSGVVAQALCPGHTIHGGVGKESVGHFARYMGIAEDRVVEQIMPKPLLTAKGVGEAIVELAQNSTPGVWTVDGAGLRPLAWGFSD